MRGFIVVYWWKKSSEINFERLFWLCRRLLLRLHFTSHKKSLLGRYRMLAENNSFKVCFQLQHSCRRVWWFYICFIFIFSTYLDKLVLKDMLRYPYHKSNFKQQSINLSPPQRNTRWWKISHPQIACKESQNLHLYSANDRFFIGYRSARDETKQR